METYTMSANQLYKSYKQEGGTLNFAGWLNREKKKGVIPDGEEPKQENFAAMNGVGEAPVKTAKSPNTILGFPTTTLIVSAVIIVGAVVAYKAFKKK